MLQHIDAPPQRAAPPLFAAQRADLLAEGWTGRSLAIAVMDGRLLRPRYGLYLSPGTHVDVVDACRQGGRLACVSELARHGIFVLGSGALHVHVDAHASRLRSVERAVRVHWRQLVRTPHPRSVTVDLVDALIQSVLCQRPNEAIATLDSALHRGAIDDEDLADIFAALPRRYRVLRKLLDRRAESGPESLVRLMLRRLGCRIEPQVWFDGIGRVDFVVDGWLVVECDSEAFHSDWESQKRDRRRDQGLAALGYTVYRPIAEDILWCPERVQAALRGLVAGRSGPRVRMRRA